MIRAVLVCAVCSLPSGSVRASQVLVFPVLHLRGQKPGRIGFFRLCLKESCSLGLVAYEGEGVQFESFSSMYFIHDDTIGLAR